MENRVNPDQQKIRETIEAIRKHAIVLHDLMAPGSAVTITEIIKPDILVPNRPPQFKSIILVRPATHLIIDPRG